MGKQLIIKSLLVWMISFNAFLQPISDRLEYFKTVLKCNWHFSNGVRLYDIWYKYDEAIEEFKKAIELNANFYAAYNEIGAVYRKKGQIEPQNKQEYELYKAGVSYHKKALEINPNYSVAHTSLGYTYICMQKYDSAMKEFVKALRINPFSYRAHLGLGWAYEEVGLQDEAIVEYQKAIELTSIRGAIYNNMGWLYIEKKEFDAAIEMFKKAIEYNKGLAQTYKGLGIAYLKKKMFNEAIEKLRESISLHREDPYAHIYLYIALLLKGERSAAEKELESTFALFPNKAIAHGAMGWCFWVLDMYKEALEEDKKALKIRPDYLYYDEVGSIYQKMEEYEQALKYYQKGLKIKPNHVLTHHKMGEIFGIKGDRKRSLAHFNKAIKLAPFTECYRLHSILKNMPEKHVLREHINEVMRENALIFSQFYTFIGWVFEKSGNPIALETYKKAIHVYPELKKGDVYEGIGRIYGKEGDYDKAISYYKKSIEVNGFSPSADYQIGSIYYMQGENLKAICEYRKALEKKKEPDGYLCIGYSLEREGRIDEAIAIYKKSIKDFPDHSQRMVSHLDFLKALSRFHLLGLYSWARRAETGIIKYLAGRGLIPRLEKIGKWIEKIYWTMSFMDWMIIGFTILMGFVLLVIFILIALIITLAIAYRL